jgi:hypothetical protein
MRQLRNKLFLQLSSPLSGLLVPEHETHPDEANRQPFVQNAVIHFLIASFAGHHSEM